MRWDRQTNPSTRMTGDGETTGDWELDYGRVQLKLCLVHVNKPRMQVDTRTQIEVLKHRGWRWAFSRRQNAEVTGKPYGWMKSFGWRMQTEERTPQA